VKILLAGGAGYIGSALAPKLLEKGYTVDAVDLLWFGNNLPLEVSIIQRNIIDLTESDLKKYDQVIFLAGLSNDPMADYSPAMNFVENGSVPAYLAYIAKISGVKRFIYGSSCSVYGNTVNKLFDETMPAISHYPYGISKLQGEFASLQLLDEGFSVISLRQGTLSGFSPRMRFDLIVNTMFKSAISTRTISVNNPTIWRPVLAMQDAISGYIKAVEAPLTQSGIFNIASGNFTVGEVAKQVKDTIKQHLNLDVTINTNYYQDYRNYKVSIDKIANTLGYEPHFNIESIVVELVNKFNLSTNFDKDSYYNIRTFQKLF